MSGVNCPCQYLTYVFDSNFIQQNISATFPPRLPFFKIALIIQISTVAITINYYYYDIAVFLEQEAIKTEEHIKAY